MVERRADEAYEIRDINVYEYLIRFVLGHPEELFALKIRQIYKKGGYRSGDHITCDTCRGLFGKILLGKKCLYRKCSQEKYDLFAQICIKVTVDDDRCDRGDHDDASHCYGIILENAADL